MKLIINIVNILFNMPLIFIEYFVKDENALFYRFSNNLLIILLFYFFLLKNLKNSIFSYYFIQFFS